MNLATHNLIAALCLAFILTTPASASTNRQADVLLKKANSAELDENYKLAEQEYRSLITDLKVKDPNSITIHRAMARLARIYVHQGHFDKAEPILAALLHTDHSRMSQDPELMVDLDDLSDSYMKLASNNHYGYEALKRALNIRLYINPKHPHLAEAYRELARFCMRSSNVKESISWMKNVIIIERGLPLQKQSSLVLDMAFLASLYVQMKEYDQAAKLAKEDFTIIKRCACERHVATQLHVILGQVYSQQNKFAEAEKEFKIASQPAAAGEKRDPAFDMYVKKYRSENESRRRRAHSANR